MQKNVVNTGIPLVLKGPEGCPLNHRRVRIQAFHRDTDLLSIHIGSWSNIELEQVRDQKTGTTTGTTVRTTPVVVRGLVQVPNTRLAV